MDVLINIIPNDSSPADTYKRLLEVAGEVFAEHGYRSATVREICKKANANIAAVNYHFRDKDGLYSAVIQYAYQCANERYPLDIELNNGATVEQQLRAFVWAFLLRIFDEGRPAWHGKLMLREMIEPTRALDSLVEKEIRPRSQQLESLVRKILSKRTGNKLVSLCARSIVAQCVYYYHSRPVISRLYPNQKYGHKDIERLADHITRFSLGALKEFRK